MKQLLVLVLGAVLAGCATDNLPKQPHLDPPAAIEYLARQDAKVKSVAGEGSVTLTRASGESVRLDMAIAAAFPDRVRLRAWKFGQAVFDLTLTPDGVWILVADPKRRDKIIPAGGNAANFLRGWSMLHGGFFTDPNLKTVDVNDETFSLERPTSEGAVVRAEVDRKTLTMRRHSALDDKRQERFSLQYEQYRVIDGIPWPTRMRAHSAQGEILVEIDDVQLNARPPENAFVAPRRAEKLP